MKENAMLNEHEAAVRLGISVWTLRQWRSTRHGVRPVRGVSFLKIGRRVLYSPSHLDAFLASHVVQTVGVTTTPRPERRHVDSVTP